MQEGRADDRLLDAPEQKRNRQQESPDVGPWRHCKRDRGRDIGSRQDQSDESRGSGLSSGRHHPRATEDWQEPQQLGTARCLLVAEPADSAEKKKGVQEKRRVVGKKDSPAKSQRRGEPEDCESRQKKPPRSDPLKERTKVDLLIDKQEQNEQQGGSCSLDEQGELVDRHHVWRKGR